MKEEQDLVALVGKPESLHLSGGKVGQKGESSVQPTLTLLTSGRIHVGHPVLSCPPPRPLLSPTPASVPRARPSNLSCRQECIHLAH